MHLRVMRSMSLRNYPLLSLKDCVDQRRLLMNSKIFILGAPTSWLCSLWHSTSKNREEIAEQEINYVCTLKKVVAFQSTHSHKAFRLSYWQHQIPYFSFQSNSLLFSTISSNENVDFMLHSADTSFCWKHSRRLDSHSSILT